ncbi:hypothetical protein [Nitrosomonas sp.]|uniref:hypothetical protein n=1 Tax=Nitrosomonas sp. TaxID=42353 RepID=UPI001DAAFD58|nr:hypothetical protein [Nitrosomonas sp.]MBX3615896.1 hypothetical protein [Nitrosomonas sp.]
MEFDGGLNKTKMEAVVMYNLVALLVFVIVILLSSCATSPESRSVSYVSPSQFQTYSCEELLNEIERIQNRVSELIGKPGATIPAKDKWILGADLSLSWAALFALGGTEEQEAEYLQLKSEYDAIQQWAVIKQCPGVIPPAERPPEFDPDMVEAVKPAAVAGQR